MKIAAIYRETRFSNRAITADKAIMDKALSNIMLKMALSAPIETLQAEHGHDLSHLSGYDYILSMAQGNDVLVQLKNLEDEGTQVLNSVTSIENCYRKKLSQLLGDGHFYYPDYIILDTSGKLPANLPFVGGFWVKRGDFHAMQDNDVQFVENIEALGLAMLDYAERGITHVVCQENITGHIIKFYGVTDKFFSHRYMGMTGPDRYDLPLGRAPHNLDITRIKEGAFLAAKKLGLAIYGGDCIVDANGDLYYIDVNDWPSFRTCADEAAAAISDHITHLCTRQSMAL